MPSAVHAQDAEADNEASKNDGEIIVTAQKRSENILKVPLSIQAFSSDSLTKAGLSSVQDLPVAVPGLMLSSGSATAAPYIRGIGTASPYAGNESAVAIYVDGVYLPAAAANVFSFNNISGVEILKGPQGTLYGRNATGGVINIKTFDPSFEATARVGLEYLNYDEIRAQAYYSGPLSDSMAIGIAGYYAEQQDGFGKYVPSGEPFVRAKEYGVRGKLLIRPGDNTEIRISANYTKLDTSKGVGVTLIHDGDDGPYQNIGFYDTLADTPSYNDEDIVGVSAVVDHDFGSVAFKGIASYGHVKSNFGFPQYVDPGRAINVVLIARETTWTGELQLTSKFESPFSFLVGAFYMHDKAIFPSPLGFQNVHYTALGKLPIRNVLTSQILNSVAGFVDATYEISDQFKVTGGIRYTKDSRDYDASNGVTRRLVPGPGGQSIISETPGNFILSDSDSDDQLTYRAIAQFDTGQLMLYGSVSTGFKSGGFSPTTPTNPPIEPEKIRAYEIGLKGSTSDSLLSYSAAGFWYEYSNLQISTVSDGRPITVNAAAARIRGVEWSLSLHPTPTLAISTNGQYLDAKYTDYKNVRSYLAIPGSLYSAAGPLIDASGKHLRIAPTWTFGASIDQTMSISSNFELRANITYQYNGGYYFYSDERVKQGAFHLLNSRIGLKILNSGVEFGIFGRNLGGEKYYTAARVSQTNGDFGTYGEPRRYGVYLSATF